MYTLEEKYDILEFYAGKARIAKCAREVGLVAGALDVMFHTDAKVFDMLSPAGFA